jgi:integrase
LIFKAFSFSSLHFPSLSDASIRHFWRKNGEHFGEQNFYFMSIILTQKTSRDGAKVWYYLEWGKAAGQRKATGVFTYVKPKDQLQKNHNKEATAILKSKQAQMVIERQAIGSGYVPSHKLKSNFLDYYEDYIKINRRKQNRHLQSSLKQFKVFLGRDYISPVEITETLCEHFRTYLLQHFNGETPADYFYKFKKVLKAAKKDGYFSESPAENLASKTKPSKKRKEMLEVEEYKRLIQTPCLNHEVKRAFVFSLYSGLRWCDVKALKWENIKPQTILIVQEKTGIPVEIPLHPTAGSILGERKTGTVFQLPTADGANGVLKKWCEDAKLKKHITWHCARLSFSVLLQDKGVDIATVAGMLGHTSTKYVEKTYQRYRVHSGKKAIGKLPQAEL